MDSKNFKQETTKDTPRPQFFYQKLQFEIR